MITAHVRQKDTIRIQDPHSPWTSIGQNTVPLQPLLRDRSTRNEQQKQSTHQTIPSTLQSKKHKINYSLFLAAPTYIVANSFFKQSLPPAAARLQRQEQINNIRTYTVVIFKLLLQLNPEGIDPRSVKVAAFVSPVQFLGLDHTTHSQL